MLPAPPSAVVKQDMQKKKQTNKKNMAQRKNLRQRRTMERQLSRESSIRVHARISPIIKVGVLQMLVAP